MVGDNVGEKVGEKEGENVGENVGEYVGTSVESLVSEESESSSLLSVSDSSCFLSVSDESSSELSEASKCLALSTNSTWPASTSPGAAIMKLPSCASTLYKTTDAAIALNKTRYNCTIL